jgi:hypothetical protein
MCYDASFVVFFVLKLLKDLLDFQEFVFYWVCQITDSINSSVEASIKALMDEHIIPLKQTLKEQQKRIDEQKEMISKQAHLAVQSIQEEQQTCTVIVLFLHWSFFGTD